MLYPIVMKKTYDVVDFSIQTAGSSYFFATNIKFDVRMLTGDLNRYLLEGILVEEYVGYC